MRISKCRYWESTKHILPYHARNDNGFFEKLSCLFMVSSLIVVGPQQNQECWESKLRALNTSTVIIFRCESSKKCTLRAVIHRLSGWWTDYPLHPLLVHSNAGFRGFSNSLNTQWPKCGLELKGESLGKEGKNTTRRWTDESKAIKNWRKWRDKRSSMQLNNRYSRQALFFSSSPRCVLPFFAL